jgi:thioredoxin-like negative regulator of GroEL
MVYGVRSIPQTYFINAEGEAVATATGMISASQLEQGIGMIYSE